MTAQRITLALRHVGLIWQLEAVSGSAPPGRDCLLKTQRRKLPDRHRKIAVQRVMDHSQLLHGAGLRTHSHVRTTDKSPHRRTARRQVTPIPTGTRSGRVCPVPALTLPKRCGQLASPSNTSVGHGRRGSAQCGHAGQSGNIHQRPTNSGQRACNVLQDAFNSLHFCVTALNDTRIVITMDGAVI